MLNYGLAGRSENVLFNLYLIDTKIEYKKIDIFFSHPLPDLRPDSGTSGHLCVWFLIIPKNHRVMVSCSLVAARVVLPVLGY